MKKILVFLILCLFSSIILAQSPIDKGSYSISGSISYSNTTDDDNAPSRSNFSFNPKVGYFIYDKIYLALSVNYEYYTFDKSSNDFYGFGPSVRYYFEINNAIKPFVGLGYHYSFLNEYVSSSSVSISGGSNIFITNDVAVEGIINYSFIKYIADEGYFSGDGKSNTLNIRLGLNYFFK